MKVVSNSCGQQYALTPDVPPEQMNALPTTIHEILCLESDLQYKFH